MAAFATDNDEQRELSPIRPTDVVADADAMRKSLKKWRRRCVTAVTVSAVS
jgi:hypothetical protein